MDYDMHGATSLLSALLGSAPVMSLPLAVRLCPAAVSPLTQRALAAGCRTSACWTAPPSRSASMPSAPTCPDCTLAVRREPCAQWI